MLTPKSLTLLLHGLAGFVALGAGATAVAFRGKLRIHRPAGLLFTGLMIFSIVTAIGFSLRRGSPFFFVLAFYIAGMLLNGWLALRRKGAPKDRPAPAAHRAAAASHTLLSLAWTAWGFATGMPIAVGLGAIGVWSGGSLWRRLIRPPEFPLAWLVDHIGGYAGAFIAATTAFTVNIVPRWLPPGPVWRLLVWFAPAALGIPLFVRIARAFRSQPATVRPAGAVAPRPELLVEHAQR